MARRRRQPRLGVATLAAYAADPGGFHARRGRAADPRAAAHGRRVHHRAGAAPVPAAVRITVWLIVVMAGVALAYWWFVGH